MKHTLFDNGNGNGYSTIEARDYLIERHLEDHPEEIGYEPTNEEIYNEIQVCDEIVWDEIHGLMKKFFDNGDTYLLRGTCGLWDGLHDCGKIINSYSELDNAFWHKDTIAISDVDGQFNIDVSHHDGDNHYEVRKLKKSGIKYLNSHPYEDDRHLHETLWGDKYSMKIHFYKKCYC